MKKYILSFCVLTLLITGRVFADDSVALFSFVTDPQSINANELSKAITIQSQSAPSTASPIGETFDLSFLSSSATGEFLNSSGNAISTTMSKNTSNRSLYYRDSTSGDFVLTVTATGRDSKRTFTATQHIYVGVAAPATSTPSGTPESSTDTSIANDSSAGVGIGYSTSDSSSAHSSQASLGGDSQKMIFEVSAGRDRLVTVGDTLTFKALIVKSQNVPTSNIGFQWTFGDGSTAQGSVVNHIYRFAGDYALVLNAKYSDVEAVARVNIKVVSPTIVLARVLGGIKISNKTNSEINLENWILQNGSKQFVLPTDTLVGANKEIVLADEVTGLNTEFASLVNPLGKTFASFGSVSTANTVSVASTIPATSTLVSIQNSIMSVKNSLAQVVLPGNTGAVIAAPSVSVPKTASVPKPKTVATKASTQKTKGAGTTASLVATSTNVANVFTAPESPGIVTRMFAWPIKGFDAVKHLFVSE